MVLNEKYMVLRDFRQDRIQPVAESPNATRPNTTLFLKYLKDPTSENSMKFYENA